MKTMLKLIIFCFSFFALTAFSATIEAKPLNLIFTPTDANNYQTVTIKNMGSDTAYVLIDVTRYKNPGNSQDQEPMTYLMASPDKFGLLVSETRLIIPPYQQRVITVTNLLQNNAVDGIYSLYIHPVTSEVLGVKDSGSKTSKKAVDVGVQFVVGYKVNVYVLPKNPTNRVEFKVKDHHTLYATNTGNSFNVLESVYACPVNFDTSKVSFAPDLVTDENKNLTKQCGAALGFAIVYANSTVQMSVPSGKKLVIRLYHEDQPVILPTGGKLEPVAVPAVHPKVSATSPAAKS